MTTAPEPGDLQRWRSWDDERKAALRLRLREVGATMGKAFGDDPDPGVMATRLDPGTVQRAHLLKIDEAFRRLLSGEVRKILITTPPQVGKSMRAAVWAPMWWLSHHPQHRIMLVSAEAGLARARGRAVRRLVRIHGAEYGLHLDPEKTASNEWELSTGGGMVTGGFDSNLVGKPADILIIDDPVAGRADADSQRKQESTWETYTGTLVGRLAPKAPTVLIMTRWSPNDLAGKLLAAEGRVEDGGEWLVVHMPALADPDIVDPDPLGRAPGEPIPHPQVPEGDVAALLAHWEEKRRTEPYREWTSQFQGDPRDRAGALVSEQLLEARRDYKTPTHDPNQQAIVAVAVDPSGGGRDTAGVVGGWLGDDDKLYLAADATARMGAEEWGRAACQMAHDLGADRIIYEQNYGKDMARLTLRTSWDMLAREAEERIRTAKDAGETPLEESWGACPRLVAVHGKRGKQLRAEPVAQQWAEDNIRTATSLLDLEKEWLQWRPKAGWSPGRIDASVYLALDLLPVPGSEALVSNPAGTSMAAVAASNQGTGTGRIQRSY